MSFIRRIQAASSENLSTSNADSSSGDSNMWAWALGIIFLPLFCFRASLCLSLDLMVTQYIAIITWGLSAISGSGGGWACWCWCWPPPCCSSTSPCSEPSLADIEDTWRLRSFESFAFFNAPLFRCEREPSFWWAMRSLLGGLLEKELVQNSISRQRMENQGSPSRFEMK